MKKYLKIENLLYLMLLISPFLDSFSFIYRQANPNSSISPVTILRPIIPIILAIYMFIKDKSTRKTFIIGGSIYCIYGIIHLYLYNSNITGISYGGVLSEAQYIINYSYMILVLYEFLYFNKNKRLDKLNIVLLIMLSSYLLLIYLSIITKTSSHTYVEGMGYKGWNLSGNSLGSILILLECITLPYIFKSEKKIKIFGIILLILLGIFLTFLLGTRTGLLGFYLVLFVYFIGNIFLNIIQKKKLNLKKYLLPVIIILVISSSLLLIFGSNTISRRKHLHNVENEIVDPNTNETSHTTGDTAKFVNEIKNNNVDENFMSKPQQKAYLDMYDFSNKHQITNSSRRIQQMMYHLYLVKHQSNPILMLFGNGYLCSYGEMILEMEFIAILVNFGIIGFILYLIPFLILYFKEIKYTIKNIKNIDIDYIMYLLTIFLAIVFSLLAGYTFFNISSMAIIVSVNILLKNKYGK